MKKINWIWLFTAAALLFVAGTITFRGVTDRDLFTGDKQHEETISKKVDNNTGAANTTRSKLDNTEAGKLLETWDWNVTTPGKALGDSIGPEWTNWVIWGVILLVVWLVVRSFLPSTRKSSSGGFPTFLGWMLAILMMVGIWFLYQNYKPVPYAELPPLNFRNAVPGQSASTVMGLNSLAVVDVKLTNINLGYRHFICPEAQNQGDFKFSVMYVEVKPVGTDRMRFRFTDETKAKLAALSVNSVDTKFTLVKGGFHEQPCPYGQKGN